MKEETRPVFEGETFNHALADLTSWHVGGSAERFFVPKHLEILSQYLASLGPLTPCHWLGLGSNVLILDEGIQGAVISTRQLVQLTAEKEGTIYAQAGVTCAKFARFCSKLGFAKAAFFAGIPGTIGGALRMNAGAFGGETWEWVEGVWTINRQGELKYRSKEEFSVAYRHVEGISMAQQQEAFVAGVFRFPHEPLEDGMNAIRELLRKRAQTQPIGTYNCGSVYRNPHGDYAARLIEACNLKGYRVGDAFISPKHANFIINDGEAKAKEVLAVMSTIETEVKARFGIQLEAEVKILPRY
jgi:UDP-N-acetylmuramate dehydrogenase